MTDRNGSVASRSLWLVRVDQLTRDALAARGGDPAAIAGFIRASQAEVWRLCAHLVDHQSADDLTQDTYLRAFRALPAFRGESSARTWLLAIARRACQEELRARTRRHRRDSVLGGHAPQRPAEPDVAESVGVIALLVRLESGRRAAFVLTQLLGLSYEEAAAVCDCAVGTIRSRVARARSDLIELLEPETDTHAETRSRRFRGNRHA